MNWPSQLRQGLSVTKARVRPARVSARRTRLSLEQLESRLLLYATSGYAWPSPQLVTLSFVPDGTLVSISGTRNVYSNLFATFNARFGSPAAWQDVILKAAQTWAQQTNLNIAVVPDDGAPVGSGSYQQGDPGMGDIRIGGYAFGNSNLAQAYMPPPANNYSIAGDIQYNTGQTFNTNGQAYDLFTVSMHEFGHALGLYGSNVISAEMYEIYNGCKSAIHSDDVNGIRAIYSSGQPRSRDAYGANTSFAAAADVTPTINPATHTGVIPNLDITTVSDQDYFTFVAPAGSASSLTVSARSSGLSLLAPTLTVYSANPFFVLGSASGAGRYGTTLSVTVNGVTAGQRYYVRVTGADTSPFGTGAYALTVNLGTGPAPTVSRSNTRLLDGNPTTGGGGQPVGLAQEFRVNPIPPTPSRRP
jgi:hypothetical protein